MKKKVYIGTNCRNIVDLKPVFLSYNNERELIAEGLKYAYGSENDVEKDYWLQDGNMNFDDIISDVISGKCDVTNMYGLGEEMEIMEEADYIKTFLTKKVYTVCNDIPSYMDEGREEIGSIEEIINRLERDKDGKIYRNDMLPVTIVDKNESEFYIISPMGYSKEEAYSEADAFLAIVNK
jgi:hypothetical protein